jgi:hypothetical protein
MERLLGLVKLGMTLAAVKLSPLAMMRSRQGISLRAIASSM